MFFMAYQLFFFMVRLKSTLPEDSENMEFIQMEHLSGKKSRRPVAVCHRNARGKDVALGAGENGVDGLSRLVHSHSLANG